MLKADGGEIRIAGKQLSRPRPGTGFIMQDHGLLSWATVEENIRLGFRIRRFYGQDGKHTPQGSKFDKKSEIKAVNSWLERLSIQDIKDKYPSQISGGQKQRVAIARTMVLQPDLLLMDEPFASLDLKTRESLQNLILSLEKGVKQTRITITHSVEEAVYMGKKIMVLMGLEKEALIFENPGAGVLEYRNSEKYNKVCKKLRSVLES